jgi:hypothetical protein
VVSRRDLNMTLSGGYVLSVRREMRMVMVDVWGVPVRLMTMGRMSVSVSGKWLRRALPIGVYLSWTSRSV